MRDDISKLNLPPAAKQYARRSGLATLGPAGRNLYLKVNKQIVNPTRPSTMKSVDVAGPVQHPGLKGSYMPKGGRPTRLANSTARIMGESDEFGPEDRQTPINWSKANLVKGVPPGAKRIHMYPAQDVLRPRGPMAKESLSADIHSRLKSAFESWTDPNFGDSLAPEKATSLLKQNLESEVNAAWQAFMDGQ